MRKLIVLSIIVTWVLGNFSPFMSNCEGMDCCAGSLACDNNVIQTQNSCGMPNCKISEASDVFEIIFLLQGIQSKEPLNKLKVSTLSFEYSCDNGDFSYWDTGGFQKPVSKFISFYISHLKLLI